MTHDIFNSYNKNINKPETTNRTTIFTLQYLIWYYKTHFFPQTERTEHSQVGFRTANI